VTGAKSGESRTVAISVAIYGIPHSEALAVIASNLGGAKHPPWYHNLKANPQATLSVEGDTWHAIARLAAPRERDEIWVKGLEIYPAGGSTKRGPATATSRRSSSAGIDTHGARPDTESPVRID
jgi:deazaflavin-dependent oxidoreductase (nitroreductase family)